MRMQPIVEDDFLTELDPRWARLCTSGGQLVVADSALHCTLSGAQAGRYSDAQIDDYSHTRRPRFLWRPPLRMEVRARAAIPSISLAAHDAPLTHRVLRGTAGFGFWNYPLSLTGSVLRLPDAVWFFYASPPSNMALVPGTPGCGWKAQVVHAHRWQAVAAGLPALGAIGLARLTSIAAPAERLIQSVTGARETVIATSALFAWHTYTLDWRHEAVVFWVDGAEVLRVSHPPQGPLGFVAWLDNQYAVATPRGDLRFGTLDSGPQELLLDTLHIAPI